jgi:hypothetical protein
LSNYEKVEEKFYGKPRDIFSNFINLDEDNEENPKYVDCNPQ